MTCYLKCSKCRKYQENGRQTRDRKIDRETDGQPRDSHQSHLPSCLAAERPKFIPSQSGGSDRATAVCLSQSAFSKRLPSPRSPSGSPPALVTHGPSLAIFGPLWPFLAITGPPPASLTPRIFQPSLCFLLVPTLYYAALPQTLHDSADYECRCGSPMSVSPCAFGPPPQLTIWYLYRLFPFPFIMKDLLSRSASSLSICLLSSPTFG